METRPANVDVAIVAAIPLELDPLRERMTNRVVERGLFRTDIGQLSDRSVVMVESGVGQENAAKAVAAIVTAFRPGLVISCGVAGGLVDDLDIGDVLFARSVLRDSDRGDAPLTLSGYVTSRCRRGSLVTVDRAVLEEDAKRRLAESSGALAVDMETYAIAKWCSRNAVNMIAVRAISDTVDETLPKLVGSLVGANVWQQTGRVAGSLIRRPSLVKDLWRLRTRALAASDRLTDVIEEIISGLEGPTDALLD